jgi:hypothetical protein
MNDTITVFRVFDTEEEAESFYHSLPYSDDLAVYQETSRGDGYEFGKWVVDGTYSIIEQVQP